VAASEAISLVSALSRKSFMDLLLDRMDSNAKLAHRERGMKEIACSLRLRSQFRPL
jgi:hypothetical protein